MQCPRTWRARGTDHRRVRRDRARDRPGAGEEGYGLTISARRPDKLEAAAEGLRDEGFEVEAVPANMADEEDDQEARRPPTASASAGSTCSINNAGIGIGGAVADAETKKLDLQLDVNLRAVYLMAREASRC